uniref:Cleavage and polyadenylation specificity factor subunit 2 n=1 Tax=Cucumis melo TaxID=3656 RepID=A0A9I9EHQ8_CUCME
MRSVPAAHKSVLVGDLKMANFKNFLANKGIQVEFPGVALRYGEYVTLCKVTNASQKGGGSGTQQVVIEGSLCEDYYKIQDLFSLARVGRRTSCMLRENVIPRSSESQ